MSMALPVYLHTYIHIPLKKTQPEDPEAPSSYTDDPFIKVWEKIAFCIEDWNYGGTYCNCMSLSLIHSCSES